MAVVVILLPMTARAQKGEDYQNSYNYLRALEIEEAKGSDEEALKYLEKEVKEHPGNGYAYYIRSLIYMENGMMGDAMENSLMAVELLKKDKEWLSVVYAKQAEIQLKLGNEDEALECWRKSLKLDPKDAETYRERAEYYYWKGMCEASDADYRKICQLRPGSTVGYMGQGHNALQMEKYDEALKLFSYCITLDPKLAEAYARRAETYLKQGKTNEAIDDIVKALELDKNARAYRLMTEMEGAGKNTLMARLKVQQIKQPNEACWPYYIGVLYEADMLYGKAIQCFETSNKILPNDVVCHWIAQCYKRMGEYDEAMKYIEQSIEMDPEDDNFIREKADLLYEMGAGKEAIATYDQYVRANPEYFWGYYKRGFLKDNLGDVDGAIEDYSMAIALSPDYAYSYFGRADMLLLKGDTIGAKEDYSRVVALDTVPEDGSCAHYAYMELGEREKAKEFMRAVLDTVPSAGNYYDAACLYARMGERDSSLCFLRMALEKGYARFAHMRNDADLDNVRGTEEYRSMMEEYERRYEERQRAKADATEEREEKVSEIPFTRESGTCSVQCRINDLPLYFIFDTGAADVSLSMVEASFMMKNGYLTKNDVVGKAYYSDAQGDISEGTVVNLRHVQFGDMQLDNVRASVVRNQKAPLLLGQTVMSRAGKIEIDNEKRVIRIRYK